MFRSNDFLNHDDKKDLIDTYHLRVPKTHVLGGIGLDLTQYPYSLANRDKIKFLFIGR